MLAAHRTTMSEPCTCSTVASARGEDDRPFTDVCRSERRRYAGRLDRVDDLILFGIGHRVIEREDQ